MGRHSSDRNYPDPSSQWVLPRPRYMREIEPGSPLWQSPPPPEARVNAEEQEHNRRILQETAARKKGVAGCTPEVEGEKTG
jgi:hypothetical protein